MTALPTPSEPAFVQRLRYLRDPIGYMTKCQHELGNIYMLRLVEPGMVFVSTPELAKEVYLTDEATLVAGEAKIAVFGKVLGDSSTLLLDGLAHRKRRRLMLPQFRGELMQGLAPAMVAACERTLRALPRTKPFALHPYMHQIAFDVISQSLFSVTPPGRRAALEQVMREFATRAVTSKLLMFPHLQIDLGPISPWGRIVRVVAAARTALLAELEQRRRAPITTATGQDILALLMAATNEDGTSLTDPEIVDEMLTMVAAGHETTSMALTWASYAIYTRPAVLAKLRAEPTEERPYLQAVIRESLRFHSVIPNGSGRVAKRAFQLGGFDVPARAMVTVAFHAVHRTLEVFKDAETFRPERFLETKFSPYEWVPFGGGTRRCLGMPSALFELGLVITELVARIELEIVQREVRPTWRGRFLTPSRGLIVRALDRKVEPEQRAVADIHDPQVATVIQGDPPRHAET